MTDPIAIVGIACRYPDAGTPEELWENVLAGRRAFRRIPDERMRLDDYWSADPAAPDKFYARKAAVIDGFTFDRVKYKIAGSTFRGTDMTGSRSTPRRAPWRTQASPTARGCPSRRRRSSSATA